MRRFKTLALILILILAFSGVGYAKGVDISGSLKSDLVGDTADGTLSDREKLNLVLEREFGFDADMHLDLEFEADHNDLTETTIHEAYLNYYTQNMDWRLGKQEINWGSAYKINPTDYFNPHDMMALKPLDDKLGVKAMKGIYYAPNRMEITGVVTPFFKADRISEAMVEPVLSATAQALSTQAEVPITLDENDPYDVEPVENKVDNVQGSFKVTQRSFYGYDLSLNAYHGRDKLPIVDSEATLDTIDLTSSPADTEATVKFVYPEVNRLGVDIIGDLGDMGVWTEVAYSDYKDEQYDNVVEAAIGADYKFENDLYLVGQGYYKQGRTDIESDTKAVNVYTSKPVFDFHEVELTTLYEVESETYMVEPQFNYSLADSVELQLGGTMVESNGDSTGGTGLVSALGRDRVYTRLNIEF